jgi:putative nucleotidyltransferase with HDIG domain
MAAAELDILDLIKYFKIRVSVIVPNKAIPFDLFILINQKFVHYLRLGEHLPPEKIHQLQKSDVFYVPEEQRAAYKRFVFQRLNDASMSSADKALILRESSLTLAEEIFEKPDLQEALADSQVLVTGLVEFMQTEPDGMADLIGLSAHDFYTYNHSLDVGIYSLGLGQMAGFTGADLVELGRGALFHDIGKKMVPAEVINRSGPLSDEDWAKMKKHPQYGLTILTESGVSEAMKACCFEHHENFLGNGYPQELPGSEIHPMARIIAITDTYDAMTTKRSYNQPMTPKDALTLMTTKLANKYDPDFLKAMYDVLFRTK